MVNKSGGNTVPRIDRAEHIGPEDTGDNIEAKRVANYLWDGNDWQRHGAPGTAGAALTERFDYAGNPIYVGVAPLGSLSTDTVWLVQRFNLSNSSNAVGDVAANIAWDDRVGATYV